MFNNPGLEVDLSLGIWPHIAVYDYDKDGQMDVVMRAASVPIKGSVRQSVCRAYMSPTARNEGLDVPVAASHAPDGKRHPDAKGVKCPHPRKPNMIRANFVDLDTDGVEDLVYSLSDWTPYGKENYEEYGDCCLIKGCLMHRSESCDKFQERDS